MSLGRVDYMSSSDDAFIKYAPLVISWFNTYSFRNPFSDSEVRGWTQRIYSEFQSNYYGSQIFKGQYDADTTIRDILFIPRANTEVTKKNTDINNWFSFLAGRAPTALEHDYWFNEYSKNLNDYNVTYNEFVSVFQGVVLETVKTWYTDSGLIPSESDISYWVNKIISAGRDAAKIEFDTAVAEQKNKLEDEKILAFINSWYTRAELFPTEAALQSLLVLYKTSGESAAFNELVKYIPGTAGNAASTIVENYFLTYYKRNSYADEISPAVLKYIRYAEGMLPDFIANANAELALKQNNIMGLFAQIKRNPTPDEYNYWFNQYSLYRSFDTLQADFKIHYENLFINTVIEWYRIEGITAQETWISEWLSRIYAIGLDGAKQEFIYSIEQSRLLTDVKNLFVSEGVVATDTEIAKLVSRANNIGKDAAFNEFINVIEVARIAKAEEEARIQAAIVQASMPEPTPVSAPIIVLEPEPIPVFDPVPAPQNSAASVPAYNIELEITPAESVISEPATPVISPEPAIISNPIPTVPVTMQKSRAVSYIIGAGLVSLIAYKLIKGKSFNNIFRHYFA